MKNHEVGDILWIVGTDRPGLQAVRVIEEVTKKTLEGEKTSYCVESTIALKKKVKKKYSLEEIKGDIFTSSSSAKQHMLTAAEEAIDRMVGIHDDLIAQYWPRTSENKNQEINIDNPQNKININNQTNNDFAFIKLENGTKARVKIPEQFKEILK